MAAARFLQPDDYSPLTEMHGVLRVGRTRVALELVLHHFNNGSSPEEIVESFPSLTLSDVYATVALYLRHKKEFDDYVAEQDRKAKEVMAQVEAQYPLGEVRETILKRWEQLKEQQDQ